MARFPRKLLGDIPPDRYLSKCSNSELAELNKLINHPIYQARLHKHTIQCCSINEHNSKVFKDFKKEIQTEN